QPVIARAALQQVRAFPAVDVIAARPAVQRVVAVAAVQVVIAAAGAQAVVASAAVPVSVLGAADNGVVAAVTTALICPALAEELLITAGSPKKLAFFGPVKDLIDCIRHGGRLSRSVVLVLFSDDSRRCGIPLARAWVGNYATCIPISRRCIVGNSSSGRQAF